MAGGIFLIQDNGQLVEMTEQPYDSEDLLQDLLARYPNLLAGQQIDAENPRRWLLVAREVGVPGEEDGDDRWSLDHLFLDQDGIPTLVEVKRSTDTRIRREVVGQMLDYAANAVSYWSLERIRAEFEARCEQAGDDVNAKIGKLLDQGKDADVEAFWAKVEVNLHAGRLRMIFVADQIPAELQRIVEFLNRQMDQAQVLAVEIKQYVGEKNLRTMVPRVIGVEPPPPPPPSETWTEARFMEDMLKRQGNEAAIVAQKVISWCTDKSLRIIWGKGREFGSLYPVVDRADVAHRLFVMWTNSWIQVQFGWMVGRELSYFSKEANRRELLRRLNEIDGIQIPDKAIDKYPRVPISVLYSETALERFLQVFEWAVEQVRRS